MDLKPILLDARAAFVSNERGTARKLIARYTTEEPNIRIRNGSGDHNAMTIAGDEYAKTIERCLQLGAGKPPFILTAKPL